MDTKTLIGRSPVIPILFALMLSGCAGGPIARQIASSLAMQVADNAVGKMLDAPAHTQETKKTNQLLMNAGIDPYQAAFLRAQLRTPPAQIPQDLPPPAPAPTTEATPVVSRLATVEVWGLVIGEEKYSMFESIRDLGIASLPPEQFWDGWQLAEGGMKGVDRPILILVPPEVGKFKSGDFAVVEVGQADGFYVARDRLD